METTDLLFAVPVPKGEWIFIIIAVYFCTLLRRIVLRPVGHEWWEEKFKFFPLEITEARSDATDISIQNLFVKSFEVRCSLELDFLK